MGIDIKDIAIGSVIGAGVGYVIMNAFGFFEHAAPSITPTQPTASHMAHAMSVVAGAGLLDDRYLGWAAGHDPGHDSDKNENYLYNRIPNIETKLSAAPSIDFHNLRIQGSTGFTQSCGGFTQYF